MVELIMIIIHRQLTLCVPQLLEALVFLTP